MDIKLIALDLDGTLLDSKKQLSSANRDALTECMKRGIWVVPCTGRTVDGIPDEIKNLKGIRYSITTNGAVIEDMEKGKPIDTRTIPWSYALDILKILDQHDVMYDPYIDRRGITEPRFFEHLDRYGLSPEIQELVRRTRDVYPNIIEFVRTSEKPVEKINLFFNDNIKRAELRKILEGMDDLAITSSMPLNLEINDSKATKGNGIIRLAKHLGLRKEQTMAVGDGENDISMLAKAGIGVAMGNGRPDLLSVADFITETNDNDGVAYAIKRLIFSEEL